MIKLLLSIIFIAGFAHAQSLPPPVSIKGMNGTKLLPKWNLQVPNSQATNLGGTDALIETGNGNVLANPGFEASPFNAGWSCPTFSCSSQVIYFTDGKQGGVVTNANAIATVVEQSVTPTFPTLNRQWQTGMWVNTNAAGFQVCSLFNGAEQACVDVPSNTITTFVQPPIFTPSSNGTVGVRLKSINANAKIIYWDQAFVTPISLSLSSPDTVPTDYGPVTITGTTTNPTKGTVVTDRIVGTRVGSLFIGRLEYKQTAAGAIGSGVYKFALPSAAGCQIDTSKVSVYTGTDVGDPRNSVGSGMVGIPGSASGPATVFVYDANNLTIAAGSSTVSGTYFVSSANGASGGSWYPLSTASVNYAVNFTVPCAGWTPQTAIQSQNSNYDYRPYTPTFTGLGTVTIANPNDCQEKREGPDNIIKCKFTTGTGTATEARISTPYTAASTFSSLQLAGSLLVSGPGAASYYVLREPNVAYLTFGFQNGSTTAQAKQNGSAIFAAGTVVSFEARYPVAGWSENQNAPQLVGSVTQGPNGTGKTVVFYGNYGGATSTTACTASGPCSLYGASSNITSLTNTSNGASYTVNVASGTCSTPLTCTANAAYASGLLCVAPQYQNTTGITAATTTSFPFYTQLCGGAATNSFGSFTCSCNQ